MNFSQVSIRPLGLVCKFQESLAYQTSFFKIFVPAAYVVRDLCGNVNNLETK